VANRIRLGNATLTRVLECQVDDLPVAVFPKTPPDAWFELADEFAPTFWNDDRWRIALQVWVVEVDGLTVLVDTGVGNDRVRPRMRQLDHLQTDFLESLRFTADEIQFLRTVPALAKLPAPATRTKSPSASRGRSAARRTPRSKSSWR